MSEPPPSSSGSASPPTRSLSDHTFNLLVVTAVAVVAVIPIPLLTRAGGLKFGPLEC